MKRWLQWAHFPWEGVLIDLLLIGFWTWALPPTSAWCRAWPHLAVWSVALLQSVAVGRMVALYMAAGSSSLLGKLSPLGGLAAVLSVGGFTWFLGAMFSSDIEWGFFTQRMPLLLVFTSLASLGFQMELAKETRTLRGRTLDAALVVTYLFLAEAFLFAMLEGAASGKRGAVVVALVLCHLPMRLVFALVPPTSRYELLSAAVAFGFLLQEAAR